MNKWIKGLLIGLGVVRGTIAMEAELTPLSVSPEKATNSSILTGLLNNPGLNGEQPEKSSTMRRSSCKPNLLEIEINSKRRFSFDRENLLQRRATFLYDLYFSTSEGPECFEGKIERKGEVEKYILTYKKGIALDFYGFMSFDSKEEFLFCLEVLAQKAHLSGHIGKVNDLLAKLRKG